jgi:hypothetical protein
MATTLTTSLRLGKLTQQPTYVQARAGVCELRCALPSLRAAGWSVRSLLLHGHHRDGRRPRAAHRAAAAALLPAGEARVLVATLFPCMNHELQSIYGIEFDFLFELKPLFLGIDFSVL